MAARKRLSSESFTAYRANLRAEERWLKGRLAGAVIWPSSERGTYRRKKT